MLLRMPMLSYLPELSKCGIKSCFSNRKEKWPRECQKSNIKIQEKAQISFVKYRRNKWHHAKVLLKGFHLNGRTIGFQQQTQELELHYMSQ